ncbi:hypothetical protein C8N25_102183 [Algoriphagus antarcticus]|uniref:Uncharacterized protein n=1 Tax=Algoriphagus antarcticus TaxID=238540 RepID=A0A3E0E591_9BACT|nr:hypothetical protein C8N25_102183 [Algoriphagus antarcticus]
MIINIVVSVFSEAQSPDLQLEKFDFWEVLNPTKSGL